jgi:hypothetical protein
MFKVKKTIVSDYPGYSCEVYLDGALVDDIHATICRGEDQYRLETNKTALAEKLLSYPPSHLLPEVVRLQFGNCLTWLEQPFFEDSLEVDLTLASTDQIEINIDIFPIGSDWNLPFTINDYISEFSSLWEKNDYEKSLSFETWEWSIDKYAEDFTISLSNSFFIDSSDEKLKDQLSPLISTVQQSHETVLRLLREKTNETFILEEFEFPTEIKVGCEQYLIYFVQFLKDLGINATSSLQEKSGKVLFSIFPTDEATALIKIREALSIYLNLPSSSITYNESFAAIRLQQQIEGLQYNQRMTEREIKVTRKELHLAQTIIESQDGIISEKNLTIQQQKKIIDKIVSSSIMVDSAENKEELEEIFDGLKVGKSKFLAEQLGIHLNPATAIKAVIDKFTGKDEGGTSILELENKNKDIE